MRGKIIKSHQSSFPNPLILKKGEKLRVEHKETDWSGWIWCINENEEQGWVPENYLKIEKSNAQLLEDYNATELSIAIGQIVQIEKEESGWVWVTTDKGEVGWIPKENIEIDE